MAMDASRRQQAKYMQRVVFFQGKIHRIGKGAVFEKGTCTYRATNPRELLVHNATTSQIQMSNFRVAHLSAGQSNR